MRRLSPFLAFAALLPLACPNAGGPDGDSGVCGGSQAKCASILDCCTGFECSLGKCVFVGGGNNNGGQNNSSGAGSSSAGASSGGGTTGQGSSSGGFGSSNGTTGHANSSGGFGGTTGHSSSTGHFGSSGSTGQGGTSGGATSGFSPDLCSVCNASSPCSGPNDSCVCDPSQTVEMCLGVNGYCAGNCFDTAIDGGNQSFCPPGTTCRTMGDQATDFGDAVCYPNAGSCVSTGGGSTSGGSTGGIAAGLCSVCAIYPTDSVPTACTDGTTLCACDPLDGTCTDGFCTANCSVADAGDPSLCPFGTVCTPTVDWQTTGIQYFACFPSDGTCLDAGL